MYYGDGWIERAICVRVCLKVELKGVRVLHVILLANVKECSAIPGERSP